MKKAYVLSKSELINGISPKYSVPVPVFMSEDVQRITAKILTNYGGDVRWLVDEFDTESGNRIMCYFDFEFLKTFSGGD